MGDRLLVRSAVPINGVETLPVRELAAGDIAAFQLRASVSKKTRGRRSYYSTANWSVRHGWLRRQGELHGFDVLTVHCTADFAKIEKTGRRFTVDRTDFTGVLQVTDAEKFGVALSDGISGCGKAFGFGMLLINFKGKRMKTSNSILINSTITTVGPLSIKMPSPRVAWRIGSATFRCSQSAQRKCKARTARTTRRKSIPATFPRQRSAVSCGALS
jgi:hypothetical protein